MENSLENEVQSRKEGELKIVRLLEDKSALLRTEIQKGTKARIEALEAIHNGLSHDLPKIQETIIQESEERE